MSRILLLLLLLAPLQLFGQSTVSSQTSKELKSLRLTPYLVTSSRGLSVVVCPGGSYFWHDMATEGVAVAEWLNSYGINAFVLKYRTANVYGFILHHRLLFRGNRYPDPQDDLREAMLYLRNHSDEFGIAADSIAVMGFSAGGHLVMSAAEFFEGEAKPLFASPVYPVVSMSDECTHARSRRGLLGDNRTRSQTLRDSLSLERHVGSSCPPIFLVNCVDDPIVDYRNSVLLDSALTDAGVPHRYLQYATGGHGFGASDTKGTSEARQWKAEFINWLEETF